MFPRLKMQDLMHWKNHPKRKPVILRGARQVGKTFLLKAFGDQEFESVHYFNFEKNKSLAGFFDSNLDPKRIIENLSIFQNKDIAIDDLIIFDEIQECPNALTSLKYFCEERENGYIVAAGSLLGIHLGSSFPVGKVEFIDLCPLNFEEFLLANKKSSYLKLLNLDIEKLSIPKPIHELLFQEYLEYMIVGGMPEAIKALTESEEGIVKKYKSVRKIQRDLIDSYVNDISKHSGKQNALHIERVWKSSVSQLSQNIDGNAKKFVFKNVLSGASSFRELSGPIDWLKKAGLVLQIPIANNGESPCDAYVKENKFKLLVHDVGLLGALAGIAPSEILSWSFGTYKGYFAENFVGQELRSMGFPLYSWNENTAEIEFLISSPAGNIPIEVKSGKKTKAKSLKVFEGKYKPQKSIIISASELKYSSHGRVYAPLYCCSWIAKLLN